MRLPMHSCDFEENTITFQVPEDVMKRMGFYPCELEVSIEELMNNAKQLKVKDETPRH